MPTCANQALDFVQKNAKKRGLFVPVSYSYPSKRHEDLSLDTETLVFIDEKNCGKITLRKTQSYFDERVGGITEGKIQIEVLKQKEEADWNSWQSNSLRWTVDPAIRKKILGETEGVIFTRG